MDMKGTSSGMPVEYIKHMYRDASICGTGVDRRLRDE